MNVVGMEKDTSQMMDDLGHSMYQLMAELFPLCRSITGAGLRETLYHIGQIVPLTITEVPSGTRVFDWVIPREWNIRDAWLAGADGNRVVEFRNSNLHVVNYSTPVQSRLTLEQLRPHLHTLPQHPSWIPYRTAYYSENWGFCLSQQQLDNLAEGEYEVMIDSSLEKGSLTYGECILPGISGDEILISSHVCHPSLANDNLSGVVVAAMLAKQLAQTERNYTYRFIFAPGTIGALTWLSQHENILDRVQGGLVLACVGDEDPVVYKQSRRGATQIDRAAALVLRERGSREEVVPFSPYGNDERQFCSPGFNLPVGAITRSGYDRSIRHHTSADDLASVSPKALADTLGVCLSIFQVLENDAKPISLNPKGEPQLGKRGLYRTFGGRADRPTLESALLWVMNLADGEHTLLDIAERAALPFSAVKEAAEELNKTKLIQLLPTNQNERSHNQ